MAHVTVRYFAGARAAAGVDQEPAEATTVYFGQWLHHEPEVRHLGRAEPTQPFQLFTDDGRLQLALIGRVDVLEVAPTAAARAGEPARRVDPVRRRGQDLDRIGPQEPRALLGDDRADALAGQRVADEHDLTLVAGDAVSTVGNRTHVEDEDRLLQTLI